MTLERVSYGVLIAACLFVGGNQIYDRLHRPPTPQERVSIFARKVMGKPFTVHVGRGSQVTAILLVSPGCHWCEESYPFYKRLALMQSPGFHVVAMMPIAHAERNILDFSSIGVAVEHADLVHIGVPSTPTLLLLDGHGKVTSVWNGKLDMEHEEQVLSNIRALSGLA